MHSTTITLTLFIVMFLLFALFSCMRFTLHVYFIKLNTGIEYHFCSTLWQDIRYPNHCPFSLQISRTSFHWIRNCGLWKLCLVHRSRKYFYSVAENVAHRNYVQNSGGTESWATLYFYLIFHRRHDFFFFSWFRELDSLSWREAP